MINLLTAIEINNFYKDTIGYLEYPGNFISEKNKLVTFQKSRNAKNHDMNSFEIRM